MRTNQWAVKARGVSWSYLSGDGAVVPGVTPGLLAVGLQLLLQLPVELLWRTAVHDELVPGELEPHTHTHTHTHTNTPTHTHTCTHVRMQAHTHTYTHTCTHGEEDFENTHIHTTTSNSSW